jgi:hypothetical protein
MEDKGVFYGCYQGNYEKMYRWQCKAFDNPNDATRYTLDNKIGASPSLLLEVNNNIPKILHHFLVRKKIENIIGVDIN